MDLRVKTDTIPVGPVLVDLINDDRVCLHYRTDGFEPESRDVWAEMCKLGSVVLDIGAYSGLFAIAAAKLGANPIAIEPMPVMAARILENAAINGVTVRVEEAVANDRSGNVRLGFNDTVHLTTGASFLRKSRGFVSVKSLRVDDLHLENVSAVKIDVERTEMFVLHGAMRMLTQNKPRMIIETLTPEARSDVERLLSGYRVDRTLDRRNLLMEPI